MTRKQINREERSRRRSAKQLWRNPNFINYNDGKKNSKKR